MAFPVLTSKGSAKGCSVSYSKDAISAARAASGLPVINKIFTFDPITFEYTVGNLISNADKVTLLAYYDDHKGIAFDWTNPDPDNNITYEVKFLKPPTVSVSGHDGTNTFWKISLTLIQYSPL